jgi:hypothetical protein
MPLRRSIIIVLSVLLLASCAERRSTVGERTWAKRRHRPGFHLDLRLSAKPRVAHAPPTATLRNAPAAPVAAGADDVPDIAVANREISDPFVAGRPQATPRPHGFTAITDRAAPPATATPEVAHGKAATQEEDENLLEPQGYNLLGLFAFMLVAGAVAAAFVTTQTLLVLGLLVVGIVLAAIALRRIRLLERRGKGFAVIALVAACLGLLLTAIAILRTGSLY